MPGFDLGFGFGAMVRAAALAASRAIGLKNGGRLRLKNGGALLKKGL